MYYKIRQKAEGINEMEQQRGIRRPAFGRTALQMIAVLTMVCDHFACVFLQPWDSMLPFGENMNFVIYEGFRVVGRLSFPIFCFLLVQGFMMTQNLKKYMLRLFVFALLSEIPYDLAFSGVLFDWKGQNVMFTLFLGLVLLARLKRFEANWTAGGIIILAGCILAFFLQTDYSYFGILLIVVMYLLRNNWPQQMFWLALLIFLQGDIEIYAVFALPFCFFYQQNKEGKRFPRYFFYAFYPIHLLVLWIIHCCLLTVP